MIEVHIFLRSGLVYIPTVGQIEGAGSIDMEPVEVVPLSDFSELRRVMRTALTRDAPVLPRRPLNSQSPLPKLAGVKSWSAFGRNAHFWTVVRMEGTYEIMLWKKLRGGGRVPDFANTIYLPGLSSIAVVGDRIIEMMQATASGITPAQSDSAIGPPSPPSRR